MGTTKVNFRLPDDLVEKADVVLENFPPTFTDKYDIGYETVREHNSEIIYCSISAYGETGPYRNYPGIDTTVQALSGAASMTRDEDSSPMRSGVPMNDVFAALYAVQGILGALRNREQTGEGDFIDISLLDAGLSGLTTRATYSFATDQPYPPFGRRHNYFAPEGLYEVDDGTVQISVVTNRHWRALCKTLEITHLVNDDRFESVNKRVENRNELDNILEEKLTKWTVKELVTALREAGLPAAPVNDTLSAFENPQAQSRDMRQTVEHPTAGEVDTIGFPVKYENSKLQVKRHPPVLGEHTDEILDSLGFDKKNRKKLLEKGVISQSEE